METHTACSASGLGKRTDGNIDTAPQADSTVLEDPVMCRTRLSGKRTQRLIVLGKAGRFVAIADRFGRIHDNWRELRVPGQAATASSPVLSLATLRGLCKGSVPSTPATHRKRPPARHFHTPSYLAAFRHFPTIFVINDE